MVTTFTPLSASIGGALIGLAAVLLFRLNGRIAGISGITHGLLANRGAELAWRGLFVVGLIIGGLIYGLASSRPITAPPPMALPLVIIAGLVVGFGTRLGSGCTSGHGVCGIARFSIRSLIATATFLACGVATATIVHGILLS